jgi:hypothetical protein
MVLLSISEETIHEMYLEKYLSKNIYKEIVGTKYLKTCTVVSKYQKLDNNSKFVYITF